MIATDKNSWIESKSFDLTWVIGPGFLSCILALLFFRQVTHIGFGLWFVLIVAVDVSHVYATLFRTYINQSAKAILRDFLWIIPFAAWAVSSCLFAYNPILFWRVLAYTALFHFIRQQYGFLRIYQRTTQSLWTKRKEMCTLYLSMLAPVIYWHTHLPRSFEWFVPGDFIALQMPWLTKVTYVLFAISGVVLFFDYACKKFKISNSAPLLILSTALSWNIGIVLFDDDFVFTVTNVLAHGIPYFALIWIQGRKSSNQYSSQIYRIFFSRKSSVVLFVLFLLTLACIEEGFWEILVQRESRKAFASSIYAMTAYSHEIQAVIVGILAAPQLTHYLIDGIIWRKSFSKRLADGIKSPKQTEEFQLNA